MENLRWSKGLNLRVFFYLGIVGVEGDCWHRWGEKISSLAFCLNFYVESIKLLVEENKRENLRVDYQLEIKVYFYCLKINFFLVKNDWVEGEDMNFFFGRV